MSLKTPRPFKNSAFVPKAKRCAPPRVRVAASAVGLLVLAPVASALELGEATMRSGLGQTLLVEIPYRLAANERLTPSCVGLAPGARGATALPAYSRVSRVSITPTHIEIFGDSRVLEPLIGLTVDVRCDTAPHFVRSYQLFVDPPARMPAALANGTRVAAAREQAPLEAAAPVAANPPGAASASPDRPAAIAASGASTAGTGATQTSRANASARARGHDGGTLAQGATYRVVRGDTLSGIAARVGDRTATIRDTAEAIFAANREAFTRGNRDLLEAGRSITIPLMSAATATVTLPEPSAVAAGEVRETEPPSAAPSPAADPSPATATLPVPAESPASLVVPEIVEPARATAIAAQPGTQADVALERTSPATGGHASGWLTALLALGGAFLLSAAFLLLRRRQRAAAVPERAKAREPRPRRLVDPVAGFVVVEEQLGRVPSGPGFDTAAPSKRAEAAPVEFPTAVPTHAEAHVLGIDAAVVDLDVGAPVAADERIDWFGDRTDAAAAATGSDATVEMAATARMAQPAAAAAVRPQSPESEAESKSEAEPDVADATIEDEHHTLTIVELDMLRQDYEAEHTLTQEASKTLRDAVADLKATQAARAAKADAAETATLEMPQQSRTAATETEQTRKLRASR